MGVENGVFGGVRFGGGYEDPRTFQPYHIFLLTMDFLFNWIIDWAHTDPLAILVIFIFQCLGLIINLIVYIMASGSQAMQSGLRKSIIYHHQLHLLTSLIYISLTCSWYIWALRKSWPSVSDQFSFTFTSSSEETERQITVSDHNHSSTTAMNIMSTTISPMLSTMSNLNGSGGGGESSIKSHSYSLLKNLFQAKAFSRNNQSLLELLPNNNRGKGNKEFYTLWSSGFIALYTVQRTVALLHYLVSLKGSFLVLNSGSLSSSCTAIDRSSVSVVGMKKQEGNNTRSRKRPQETTAEEQGRSILNDSLSPPNVNPKSIAELHTRNSNRDRNTNLWYTTTESALNKAKERGKSSPKKKLKLSSENIN